MARQGSSSKGTAGQPLQPPTFSAQGHPRELPTPSGHLPFAARFGTAFAARWLWSGHARADEQEIGEVAIHIAVRVRALVIPFLRTR